jgi:hypothetical protein
MKQLKLAILALFVLSFCAGAVTLSLDGPDGSINDGSRFIVTVNLDHTEGTNVSNLQFTITNLSWPAIIHIGQAGSNANKKIVCGSIIGGLKCIVFGDNSDVLENGILANIHVTIPRGTPPGTKTFTLVDTLGATTDIRSNVVAIPVTTNPGIVIKHH